jgi:uncharacterized protein (DUF2235 family)
MPKNIVVCCDGTGNQYGSENSNVVKLYWTLTPHDKQFAYYHPGVGTMGSRNALSTAGKLWTRVRGLAFGYGFSDNIADVYAFLMGEFQPGDSSYIFGFSRGSYTARALRGVLNMFGLLTPGNEALIPYALRLYKGNDPCKFKIADGFQDTFSISCTPYFLGLWDTVSSLKLRWSHSAKLGPTRTRPRISFSGRPIVGLLDSGPSPPWMDSRALRRR